MAPMDTDLSDLSATRSVDDANAGFSAMRVCRYAALALTGLGILLTSLNPDGSGPVVGIVGAIAALALHWWKANA
jgi:hypothetical protein